MTTRRPPLAQGGFDRDVATRDDPECVRAAWDAPSTRVLCLRDDRLPVIEHADGSASLSLVPVDGPYTDRGARGPWYLGRFGDAALFGRAEEADAARDGLNAESWLRPLDVAMRLPEEEREAGAVLLALAHWHAAAGYSPRDGMETVPALGGWARLDAHGGEHFPRTDPAVIVLVEHDDRVLLGSNVLWESGRFSLLAGFVEAGESLEGAVAREVLEESGMDVDDIQYVSSQPWPFPRSLMLGFRARLRPGSDPLALSPDPHEISELRWFTREEVRVPAPGIILPGPLSIARWMLDRWVAEGDRV